ncbi:MAG: imidazole glycerol phosphate synthase subunit HisH [Candidatus Omnitrophica bacterium]|nr:imidazole glycerol phosphate synthase subunit HisH [Candidatus Omnitrophota bacterium]
MIQKIGIIDYGNAGNIFNIKKALEATSLGMKISILHSAKDLKKVDKIILPGVGTYRDVMSEISAWLKDIKEGVLKKPTLGICLGMQILSEKGYEYGETVGLSAVGGEVLKMPVKGRIPHIGWSTVETIKPSKIMKGIAAQEQFYFMHSYELVNYTDVVALSTYNDHKFVAVVEKGNVFGVQFHPEKSREAGLKILKNFINL